MSFYGAAMTYRQHPRSRVREGSRPLRHLGLLLMERAEEVIDEDVLLDVIAEFQGRSAGRLTPETPVKNTDTLIERDGILVRSEDGRCRFVHLTFQEYFAAIALSTQAESMQIVVERSSDPRWEEVVRLYGGTLDASRAKAFFGLLADSQPLTIEWQLFIARCVGDVPTAPDTLIQKVTSDLLDMCFTDSLASVASDAAFALAALSASRMTPCWSSLMRG